MISKKWIVLFISPSLVGFLIFYLIPFISGFYISLIDNMFTRNFIGLKNYYDLITNSVFQRAVKNSLIFTGIAVPLAIIFSLFIAVRLLKPTWKVGIHKSLLLVPVICPSVSVIVLCHIFLEKFGVLNLYLSKAGIETIDWYNSRFSMVIIVFLFLWKNIGYNMILFIAGLSSIPKSYTDVARSYGAGSIYIFFRITLIYLMPTIFFITVITTINSFKIFKEIYLLTGSYPSENLYMIQHFMNNSFIKLNLERLTSASYLFAIIIFLFILAFFRRSENDIIYK